MIIRRLIRTALAVLASASLTACAGGPGFRVDGGFCVENPPEGCRESDPPAELPLEAVG